MVFSLVYPLTIKYLAAPDQGGEMDCVDGLCTKGVKEQVEKVWQGAVASMGGTGPGQRGLALRHRLLRGLCRFDRLALPPEGGIYGRDSASSLHAVAATASTRRTRLFRDGVRATQDPVIEDKHAAALEKTISKASDASNSGKDFSFGSDEVPPEVKDMSTGHAISA